MRVLSTLVPTDAPPAAFGPVAVTANGVLNTASLLIDAARETGQLDALADDLKKFAAEKVENAQLMFWLAQIARGQGGTIAPELEEYLKEYRRKVAANAWASSLS